MDKWVYRAFWTAEGALGVLILAGGLAAALGSNTGWFLPGALNRLRYASVLLCLSFALFWRSRFRFALFLAACADFFLIFTVSYLPGIVLFFLVQNEFRHFLRLSWSRFLCWGAGTLTFSAFLAQCLSLSLEPVATVSLFYAGTLLGNLREAVRGSKKRPDQRLLALSLTLLLLCDFHVALGALPADSQFAPWLSLWIQLAPVFIWLFYLPAQAMLASSFSSNRFLWAAQSWDGSRFFPGHPQSPACAPAPRPPQ